VLWLYHAEDSILMIEVVPKAPGCSQKPIGQVMLKRLLSAEQVIERLCEENVFQPHWHQPTAQEAAQETARDMPANINHEVSVRPRTGEVEDNREPAIAYDNKPKTINAS